MYTTFRLACAMLFLATAAAAQVGIGFGGVAHDGTQPVELVADSLTVDQAAGRAIAAGNVLIIQGDLRLAAGEVEVIYTQSGTGTDISTVLARGGVLVTRGEDAAEGAEAEYNVAEATLTLVGDVLVTQGATAISGQRMEIDLTTGSGTVSGRVRTVLQGQSQ